MNAALYKSNKYKISQEIVNEYAFISGGEAKIHTDPSYANETVFKGTLVHGLYLVVLMEYELQKVFPEWKGSIDVNFLKPIKVNEEFKMEFNNLRSDEIEVSLVKDNEQIAVSGLARVWNV